MDYKTDEREIAFSRTVKAGKRIYYIDVKRTRTDDYYLSLTESKKVTTGVGDDARVTYEKHKLFLYREDFDKVMESLTEAIRYVEEHKGKSEPRSEAPRDIHLDIEF